MCCNEIKNNIKIVCINKFNVIHHMILVEILVSMVPFLNVVPSTGSVLVYLYPDSKRIHVFVTLSDMY